MFPQTTVDEKNKTIQNNPHRIINKKSLKKKKKRKANKKKGITKKNFPQQTICPTVTMSSWAESFTNAATWQMKQQIAYWKSKATALEYENRLLHDIIRKNYSNNSQGGNERISQSDSDTEDIAENHEESDSSQDEGEEDDDIEVSEEFIQFLMTNAKYKEDARKERERLKASRNTEQQLIKEMEAMPTKSTINTQDVLKEMYGENWQRIAALETSVQSQFMEDCDHDKPEYWPIIPLNY